MLLYIDTSTLLKLIVEEEGSDRAAAVWDGANNVSSISLIVVEARAALAAATRARRITPRQHAAAKSELSALMADLYVVELTDQLITSAAELAEFEELRGYDAVHLAGALTVGADVLTSADAALCAAAARRGLHIANPLTS
jgi:predicted nucleic acid-binding protein